jgi:hypothetical protein
MNYKVLSGAMSDVKCMPSCTSPKTPDVKLY